MKKRQWAGKNWSWVRRLGHSIRVTKRGCWMWRLNPMPNGYGQTAWRGKNYRAHRLVWIWLVGPLNPKLVLDHICRRKMCVNPAHLREVTQRENLRTSHNHVARYMVAKRCVKGHLFNAANTYLRPTGGRSCTKCRLVAYSRWVKRVEDGVRPPPPCWKGRTKPPGRKLTKHDPWIKINLDFHPNNTKLRA